jgi:hypothetical protein
MPTPDTTPTYTLDELRDALALLAHELHNDGCTQQPHPHKRETKSQKVQLLLYPSLYAHLKARAEEEGESINNLVNILLERALTD